MRQVVRGVVIAALLTVACARLKADDAAIAAREAVSKASEAYAAAYNKRDFEALADQWVAA